ncbi:hypothetical protein HUS23_02100 [Ectothiorhodospiraceae bacterium 2226]|nr:hypothetical protein HUS23_02100 [Ectothiorhodospiraceae bacterium 2226]
MLTKKDLDRIERNVMVQVGAPVAAYCAWDPSGLAVGVMLREGRGAGFLHVLNPRVASLDDLQAELRDLTDRAAEALSNKLRTKGALTA